MSRVLSPAEVRVIAWEAGCGILFHPDQATVAGFAYDSMSTAIAYRRINRARGLPCVGPFQRDGETVMLVILRPASWLPTGASLPTRAPRTYDHAT